MHYCYNRFSNSYWLKHWLADAVMLALAVHSQSISSDVACTDFSVDTDFSSGERYDLQTLPY